MKRKMLMRKMNKFYKAFALGAMLAMALPMAAKAETAEVKISEKNFPDAIFREYVKTKYDSNGDNLLDETELRKALTISLSGKKVTSLQGIELLPYIERVDVTGNGIQSLDVRKNLRLEKLACANNKLTELKINKNNRLLIVNCNYNPLTECGLGNNIWINKLSISGTQVSTVDVTKYKYLSSLECEGLGLSELDLSGNPMLRNLNCGKNSLTQLDFSNNKEITDLNCAENQLVTLDLSGCCFLTTLYCYSNQLQNIVFPDMKYMGVTHLMCHSNELSTLDVTKFPKLSIFTCGDNALWCIDMDNKRFIMQALGGKQKISVEVDADGIIDLSHISGMDVTKITNLKNGILEGKHIVVTGTPVTYDYPMDDYEKLSVSIETKLHTHSCILVGAKDPTCGMDGNKEYYSCNCGKWFWDADGKELIGEKEEAILPRTGEHQYGEAEVITVATCSKEGEKNYTCKICENVKVEKIPKLSHEESSKLEAATLVKDGKILTVCELCKKTLEKTVIYKPVSAKVENKTLTYDGKTKKPKLFIKDSKGNRIVDVFYDVKYPTAVKVGTYKAKATLKSLYSGSMNVTYKVLPPATQIKKANKSGTQLVLNWEMRNKQVDGYEIQYSTGADFASGKTKTIQVNSYKTNCKIIKNLGKKKYYFRIRTVKKVAGKTYQSVWSKSYAVDLKK